VAQRYEERFKQLDWTQVVEIDEGEPHVGHLPHPQNAYIKAYLVKIEEGFAYMTQLHKYLSEHAALVWLIGFRLKPAAPPEVVGFDGRGSLPTARHLRRKLRTLNQDTLWVLSVGGQADRADSAAGFDAPLVPPSPTPALPARPRLLSCFTRGLALILAALLRADPCPLGRLVPDPWPAIPDYVPIL